ncbi:hypothetical protein Tco_1359791 [Tanacetum coccineum]
MLSCYEVVQPSSDQILEALHIHPLLTVKGMPECQNHLQNLGESQQRGAGSSCGTLACSSSERLDTFALLRKMTPTRAVLYSSMHDQKGEGILEEPTVDWKGSPSTPNEHGGIRAAAFVLGHVADIYMNGTIGQRKELGYATTWHNWLATCCKIEDKGHAIRNFTKMPSGSIVVAFEAFQQLSKVSIWPTTAISAVSSMHEDICNGAECNRAAMIILPFHKHLRLDGQLETTRGEHVNCLEHAPCSVGILVDRGFGGHHILTASNVNSLLDVLHFLVVMDDHEELPMGAEWLAPWIQLIVVTFFSRVGPVTPPESITVKIHEPTSDTLIQSTDDEVIADFKKTALSKSDTMKYDERVVKNGAEKIDIIREYARSNLFLVGRMPEGEVLEFLNKKNECPEMVLWD